MSQSFFSCIHRELRELFADRWLLSLVSWIPLLLLALMWLIFSQGIPREVPMGVIDLDKSTFSRTLVRHYQTSPTLTVDDGFMDMPEGEAALRSGKIYALAVIPADFEANAILGRSPQVTVFVNSQFLLVGKTVTSALLQAQGTFNAQLEVGKNLASGSPVINIAIARALPTVNQITPLFNISLNYAQFLISAILPAIWQIFMVAATVLSMAAVHRNLGLTGWLGDSPFRALLAKFLPLSLIFWLHGAIILAVMYVWIGWPMHGSWSLLLFTQLLTAWASIAVGSLLFFITRDADISLSIASSYVAPGLAFMGVTFPVTDMTSLAKIWRSLLPITHYVEVQFGQVNYGASLTSALPKLLALSLFSIPMILVFILAYWFSKKAQKGETA